MNAELLGIEVRLPLKRAGLALHAADGLWVASARNGVAAQGLLRAANNHDKLVEALKQIIKEAEGCEGEWSAVTETYIPHNIADIRELRNIAETALKDAEGE